MSHKWYQAGNGDTSSMRIMAMIVVILGAVVILASLAGWFLHMGQSIEWAGIGLGLIGIAKITKAWQQGNEAKQRVQEDKIKLKKEEIQQENVEKYKK